MSKERGGRVSSICAPVVECPKICNQAGSYLQIKGQLRKYCECIQFHLKRLHGPIEATRTALRLAGVTVVANLLKWLMMKATRSVML